MARFFQSFVALKRLQLGGNRGTRIFAFRGLIGLRPEFSPARSWIDSY